MEQSQNSLTWTLLIEGKVQNVGYRRFAQRSADGFKLGGWVRNLADGNVEIRVTGSKETLDLFVDNLHAGPPGSAVTRVTAAAHPRVELFARFDILRE